MKMKVIEKVKTYYFYWYAEKWSTGKKIPGKMVSGKKFARKMVPGKMSS